MLLSHSSSVPLRLRRRDFLHVGTAGLLGASCAALEPGRLAAAPDTPQPPARNVIQIFLTGGPATIDMWDLKPEAPEKIRGEFRPIDTSVPGMQICDQLPRLARQMHLATLVRSVTHTIAEHTQGQAYLMTGNKPRPAAEFPSLGALWAALKPAQQGIPVNMTLGPVPASSAGELGAVYNPFELSLSAGDKPEATSEAIGLPEGFTSLDLERRRKVLTRLDNQFNTTESTGLSRQLQQYQQEALEILKSDRIRAALDIMREPEASRDPFGNSSLGRGALVARRLVEAGARFITIGFGDWDTHDNNFTRLRNTLLPQLDQALAALLADLSARGMLQDTIVYCAGEFGRTPGINSTAGRDHWSRAMTVLLAGGGFRAGSPVGATDELGSDPVECPCSPDDVSATIFERLGIPPTHLLQTAAGRVVPIFRNGAVLRELL